MTKEKFERGIAKIVMDSYVNGMLIERNRTAKRASIYYDAIIKLVDRYISSTRREGTHELP